jgi:hypothetical protein
MIRIRILNDVESDPDPYQNGLHVTCSKYITNSDYLIFIILIKDKYSFLTTMQEPVESVPVLQKACTDRNNNQNVYKYIFLVGQDCYNATGRFRVTYKAQ